MGDFSPKVMAAIMYAILTLLAFSVYPMLVGAGNTIHLNTENACVWNGIRFDRVLAVPNTDTSTDADDGDWSNSLSLTKDGTGCTIGVGTAAAPNDDQAGNDIAKSTAYRFYVPTGEYQLITTPDPLAVDTTDWTSGEWKAPEGMFTDNATLVDVVIGALALLIGVSPMSVLGMIGYYILNKFDMEQGTIATIIMVVLGADDHGQPAVHFHFVHQHGLRRHRRQPLHGVRRRPRQPGGGHQAVLGRGAHRVASSAWARCCSRPGATRRTAPTPAPWPKAAC